MVRVRKATVTNKGGYSRLFFKVCSILLIKCGGRTSATRKLLISLAASDLSLGVFVLPLAISNELLRNRWIFGSVGCRLWLSLDIFFCTATIANLVAVAFDKFIAVCRALRYNRLMAGYRITLIVLAPWLLAVFVSIPFLGFYNWSWIMREKPQSVQSNLIQVCSIRNIGSLMRHISGIFAFGIPACLFTYAYFKVFLRVIRNARELNAGVMTNSSELTKLRPQSGSKGLGNLTDSNVSTMRVHVGGQSCFMKVNRKPSGHHPAKLFSQLPSTIRCGFLIVSATLPARKPNAESSSNQNDDGGDSNMYLSTQTLNVAESLRHAHEVLGEEKKKRTSHESSPSPFLKPPKWNYSHSRRSDSDFANLKAMRRCALMPVQPRLHHSVSTEMDRPLPGEASAQASPHISAGRGSVNTVCPPKMPSSAKSEPISKREVKTIYQFIVNCGTFYIGWMPFFVIQILEDWLPLHFIPSPIFRTFYWIRFFTTALNPFVYGSSSEELRKSFRQLIYCGHPKQEKKVLKRLVLAGLGAAGIPYGRPLVSADVRRSIMKDAPDIVDDEDDDDEEEEEEDGEEEIKTNERRKEGREKSADTNEFLTD
ncbi:unnamed protein product [Calicophoron daubneyi]|uniref:G-protein coupled receptors family 1 profile domain-containing protein n=1 Tax=Calicophoron daubneyi TaxID=300641 RepID=A0AAV2T0Z1_CALDB